MRIFKTKEFQQWMKKQNLADHLLIDAVIEMENGLSGTNLGGHVYKKRISLSGRGKSSGARTLIVYKQAGKAFFVYGYARKQQANIKDNELKALKLLATRLLSYSDVELEVAIDHDELIEIKKR